MFHVLTAAVFFSAVRGGAAAGAAPPGGLHLLLCRDPGRALGRPHPHPEVVSLLRPVTVATRRVLQRLRLLRSD